MVEIRGLNIVIDSKKIISDFSLTVRKGEKIVITGASGIGKSQILNSIMGLVRTESGSISVQSTVLSTETVRRVRSHFAWVPQEFTSIADGMVSEAIHSVFRLSANKQIVPDRDSLHKEFAELLLPEGLLEADFATLSGGEKQRVAIVIAKLLRRDIIILDEPTSALDELSCTAVIKYILSDPNSTVISTSHDPRWVGNCSREVRIGG